MIEPVEYRPSRLRMAVVAAFLLALAAGGAWLAFRPDAKRDDVPTGVAALVLFGPAFVATLVPLLRPRARLRIDADGISERGHFGGEILSLPWSNLARVEPFRWRLVPVLALVPRDPDCALAEGPPGMARAAQANERTYGRPFVLDPRMYGRWPHKVQEEIERRLAFLPSEAVAYPRPDHSGHQARGD